MVEQYHAPLWRVYIIICKELKGKGIDKDVILQIAVKVVNDIARLDGIVLTLLVFGAYPRMVEMDPLAATIA